MSPKECRRLAHIPDVGHWARRWVNTIVCDAWPVRRQTYSNLRNPIITWARKDERLSRPSWLTYSGQFANEVVNCPVVSRAHDRESSRVITGIWQSYIIWYHQLRYRGILEIDKRRLSTQRMLPDTPMTANVRLAARHQEWQARRARQHHLMTLQAGTPSNTWRSQLGLRVTAPCLN